MAYQGISPRIYQQNNLTNVQLIDDISSQFNGTTTRFTMTSGGDTFHAVASRAIFIVLGGIVQEPDVDYTTAGDEITFTTAPVSGLSFAGRKIYGLNKIEGINDGLVTPSKLSLGGPSWDNSGNTTISGYATVAGDITQSGETNNVYINTDIPTVRPTLDLNFERDQRLDSRITFSRNSTATYLGSDGLIKTAQSNIPRFEFDTDGNCLGLLIEESRQNGVSDSISMTLSAGVSVEYNTSETLSPDGTNNATKITRGAGFTSYSEGTSTTGVASFFAKKAGNRYVQLVASGTGFNNSNKGPVSDNVVFDFDTETFIVDQYGGFTYQKYPNGWYRFWIKYTTGSVYSGTAFYLFAQTDASNGVGDNIDETGTVYGWGMQYEVGDFPTSYIPTSGSTVTRSADNLDILYNKFYNDNLTYNYASTFYAEAKVFKANQTNMIVEGYIGSSLKDFSFNTMSGAKMQYVHRYTATNSYDNDLVNSTVFDNVFFKTAMSYTGTDGGLHGTINGRNPVLGEDDLGAPNAGGDTMAIGRRGSNNTLYLNGHLKRFIYYPAKFTSNQLQNLTK